MKKAFACMLILMMIFSFSCVKKAEEVVFEPIPTVEPTPEPTKEKIMFFPQYAFYEDFEERINVEAIKYIIVGKVLDQQKAVNFFPDKDDLDYEKIVTRSEFEILDIYRDTIGDLEVGDKIFIDQEGGETDKKIFILDGMPLFKKDAVYLVLVYVEEKPNYPNRYLVNTPAGIDGYAEIIDGKIYKAAPLRHFEEGMELSLIKDKIMSVVDGTYDEKYRREDLIRRAEREGMPFYWYFEPEDYTEEDHKRIYYGDYEGAEGFY